MPNNLKHLRTEARLTQQELADRIGRPQPRIAELERMDSLDLIAVGRLQDIADVLGCTVEDLAGT